MVYLARESIGGSFYASQLSSARLFCILIYIIIVLLPFFVAYATNGFWTEVYPVFRQPNVHFRNELIMYNYGDSVINGFSTIADLDTQFVNKIRSPSVKVLENDLNNDGMVEYIDFQITFMNSEATLTKSEIFLFFDYGIYADVRLQMIDFVVVEFSSGVGMSGGRAYGDLNLRQTTPLKTTSVIRNVYNESLLSNYTLSTDLSELITSKADRNESLKLSYSSFVYPSATTDFVQFDIRIRIPSQQKIRIFPNLLEYIKFAWFQYLSLLIPITIALRGALRFVYKYRLTKVRSVDNFDNADIKQH